jgi:hypothetical protein
VRGTRPGAQFPRPEVDRVAVGDLDQPVFRDWLGLDVELPLVADRRTRARDQPRGVDEVGRAALVDVHVGVRAGLGEDARAAGVVEVNVREHDRREVRPGDADLVEGREDPVGVGADARVDDGGPVGLKQVDGAVAVGVVHTGVDVVERTVRDGDDVAGSHTRWEGAKHKSVRGSRGTFDGRVPSFRYGSPLDCPPGARARRPARPRGLFDRRRARFRDDG